MRLALKWDTSLDHATAGETSFVPSCKTDVVSAPLLNTIRAGRLCILISEEEAIEPIDLCIWTGILLVLTVGRLILHNAANGYYDVLSCWICHATNADMKVTSPDWVVLGQSWLSNNGICAVAYRNDLWGFILQVVSCMKVAR